MRERRFSDFPEGKMDGKKQKKRFQKKVRLLRTLFLFRWYFRCFCKNRENQATGRRTVKVVPFSGSDATVMLPL